MWGSPEEYADYCDHVMRLIREYAQIPVRSLLNIGCGGGKNVFNLKRHYAVTGLELSPRMLELAQELNPECEFVQGDMRTFVLDRPFDAVLVDDAVSYMVTRPDLRSAFVAAWQHLNPGGIMIVGPDDTKETFVQNHTVVTPAAGKTRPANIEVTFVENSYDPDPGDDQYEATMVYLIREDGRLRVETDRHVLGLFTLDVWRETLTEVGFRIRQMPYVEKGRQYTTFACLRPACADGRAADNMNIKVTSFEESEADIRFVRDTVFGDEQNVPRELDWDGKDRDCVHVVAADNGGQPVGTGRMQPDGTIGRLSVLQQWRGRGVGMAMLGALIESASSRGLEEVHLHAQVHAIPFYERNGFQRDGPRFVEAGIEHVNMTRNTHPGVGQVSSEAEPCVSPDELPT